MEIPELRCVSFKKEYYTIPEAIRCIDKQLPLNIPTKPGKANKGKQHDKESPEYKTIYQRLRRELEAAGYAGKNSVPDSKLCKKDSSRKIGYSRVVWTTIVDRLYVWLCEKARVPELETLKEWEREQKASQRESAIMTEEEERQARLEQAHSDQPDTDAILKMLYEEAKLRIVVDFVCSKFIKVKEDLLKEDIERDYFAEQDTDSIMDHKAADRLLDLKNYYEVKNTGKKAPQSIFKQEP